jgi:hypothetical protein
MAQVVAVAAAVAASTLALRSRSDIGMKGGPVPADSVVLCILASAVAAYVTTRVWHWLPAPLIAGVVGALAGGRLGPNGVILGLFIGLAVTVVVAAESRLTRRCS